MDSKKKSPNGCAVRGCTVTFANRPEGLVLYNFPNDERLPRWIQAVKGEGSDWVLPKTRAYVCGRHFEPEDFWPDPTGLKKPRLLPGAVPSLFPQLPPASTIVRKLIPNSNTYAYRKKGGVVDQSPKPEVFASSQQQQSPNLANKTPVTRKTGTSVLRNITNVIPRSLNADLSTPVRSKPGVSLLRKNVHPVQSASESPAADMMEMPLTPPITPLTPASNAFESSPSSSTPTGLLSSPLPSRKRDAFPLDATQTPSKALVLSGPPAPVCLDIEEGDSPRKIALKQMIIYMEQQLKSKDQQLKSKDSIIKKLTHENQVKAEEVKALKDIIRKALDFDLCVYSIDAPSYWDDNALIWHARPALTGH